MRSGDCSGYFLAQFREELRNKTVPSESLTILRFKEFFPDNAVGIDKDVSRAGKPLLHPGGFLIEDAISPDDL
jgi:hypothetical protein